MSLVLTERPEESVVVIRLNRPEARNALNSALRAELAEQFVALGDDPSVRCVVVTGDRQAFAAGADLKEIVDHNPLEIYQLRVLEFWRTIARFPKPLIAAVNGYALGGGSELALHADIIVAGEGAIFGQPEVRVGIMAGGGATQRLVRAVGKYKAMKLLLTGERISAAEAFQMGFVSQVVPDQVVLEVAVRMAVTIAGLPPLAVKLTKEVVLAGADAPLDTALMLERRAFEVLFASRDQKEGMRAFIEGREPRFEGR